MNCIKNERIKNEIIKNERIKNERIKNELIKKRTDPRIRIKVYTALFTLLKIPVNTLKIPRRCQTTQYFS